MKQLDLVYSRVIARESIKMDDMTDYDISLIRDDLIELGDNPGIDEEYSKDRVMELLTKYDFSRALEARLQYRSSFQECAKLIRWSLFKWVEVTPQHLPTLIRAASSKQDCLETVSLIDEDLFPFLDYPETMEEVLIATIERTSSLNEAIWITKHAYFIWIPIQDDIKIAICKKSRSNFELKYAMKKLWVTMSDDFLLMQFNLLMHEWKQWEAARLLSIWDSESSIIRYTKIKYLFAVWWEDKDIRSLGIWLLQEDGLTYDMKDMIISILEVIDPELVHAAWLEVNPFALSNLWDLDFWTDPTLWRLKSLSSSFWDLWAIPISNDSRLKAWLWKESYNPY